MRIEAMTLEVRPRHPYEAADLGIRFAAANAAVVWRFWCLAFLPVLLMALGLDTFLDSSLGVFLLWWLKPWYDYNVQWALSRRVFGETPRVQDAVRAWPSFFRAGLPGALTVRRFSWSRAYLMPVRLLEGLQGKALDTRIHLMRRHATAKARMVFQVFSLIETALLLSAFSTLLWFGPTYFHFRELMGILQSPPDSLWHALFLTFQGLAMTLVEPFYASAGFMLYLNRRTALEGWDIELGLRRMRNRLTPGSPA